MEDLGGSLELSGGGDHQVGADSGRGGPLLERGHSGDQRVEVLLLARSGPRRLLRADTHAAMA